MAISSYTPSGKDYTQKVIGADNYLDIQDNGWAQQYLPDLMEKKLRFSVRERCQVF